MRFLWCTITVNDMDESLAFYREIVGLPLNRRFNAGPGMEIAMLGDGETQVELICRGNGPVQIGPDVSLGFMVDSVDKKMESLKEKGIAIHSGPVQPNPHLRFFHVLDPNGLMIQFAEML